MNIKKLFIFSLLIFTQITYAGEKFTKISITGEELPDYAFDWSCVQHNMTGQIWEVKTEANKDYKYFIDDFDEYVTKINNQGLCGYSDWRVPSIKELNSITDKTTLSPAIDTKYFANTKLEDYWSSTFNTVAANEIGSPYAWFASFRKDGHFTLRLTGSHAHLRLVRGKQYFDYFNYTKLDVSGNELPDNASSWSCIRDNRSGLTWEVKTTENKDDKYTFSKTLDYAILINRTNLCGYTDWRIPELDELITLVDYNAYRPAIKTTYFPNTNTQKYWSGTPYADIYNQVWFLDFVFGYPDYSSKAYPKHVRLVRDGKSSISLSSDNKNKVEELFDWAEREYLHLFSTLNRPSIESGEWYFRYYPIVGNYLGINTFNMNIYVLGDTFGGLVQVGTLESLLQFKLKKDKEYEVRVFNPGDTLKYSISFSSEYSDNLGPIDYVEFRGTADVNYSFSSYNNSIKENTLFNAHYINSSFPISENEINYSDTNTYSFNEYGIFLKRLNDGSPASPTNSNYGVLIYPKILEYGKSWSSNYILRINDNNSTEYNVLESATIVAKEILSTPFGDVETFKIDYRSNGKEMTTNTEWGGNSSIEATGSRWYAPKIGIIKETESGKIKFSDFISTFSGQMDLIDYNFD